MKDDDNPRVQEIEAHLEYLDENILPEKKFEWEEVAWLRQMVDFLGQQNEDMCNDREHAHATITSALAQLRHLYVQLIEGHVKDPVQLAEGLLAPQIRRLEKLLQEKQES